MRYLSQPAWCLGICLVVVWLVTGLAVEHSGGPLEKRAAAQSALQTNSLEASEALREAGRHLAAVTAKTIPSVVNIESTHPGRNGDTEETGSGVIMRSPRTNGLFVITNRHVVEGARLNQIDIHLHDGRVITPTEKLEDPDSDLAVLRLPNIDAQAAQFGDSDNLDIGHFVLAMGSPFGLTESVTLGIISAKGRRALELPGRHVVNQDFLQTDAAINPGNSGGPLIDLDGRVVGINTAIASQGGGNEGIGFSIPSNLVQFVVNQLLETGRVRRGYLGVQLDDRFDFEAARRYGLDRRRGARVTKVMDNTPAALAGIRPDDIILNFDGFQVADERDLINKVSVTPVNKQVRVVVLRGGKTVPLTVVLSEKPDKDLSRVTPPASAPKPQTLPTGRQFRPTSFSTLSLTGPLAVQCGYSREQQGLLVRSLPPSPENQSKTGGLMLYDLIEEAARVPVKTPDDLQQVLQSHEEAETILLKVRRIVDGVHQELLLEVPRTLLVTEGLTTDGGATTERRAGSSHQTVTSSSPADETI
jgi:Trypsin-like serine proteases, typically periplasmic, contain C-terminal PDZ domain